METHFSLPQESYEAALQTITQKLPHCTVYAFGYRGQNVTHSSAILQDSNIISKIPHLDLLVFSDAMPYTVSCDISSLISERSGTMITVSLLLHKTSDLATKQTCQQWFYWMVLRRGRRLCINKSDVPYLPDDELPVRDLKALRAYWLKCEAVAAFHLNAATENRHVDVELIKISLLHQAAEQIGLGLIRVFLGYTPNDYRLKFLLELCGHFTALPVQIFPNETPLQQKRYKMLCAPPSMLRHWSRLEADEADFLSLLDACSEFLKNATLLIAAELDRLEMLTIKIIEI
jgi:hypothetical protein